MATSLAISHSFTLYQPFQFSLSSHSLTVFRHLYSPSTPFQSFPTRHCALYGKLINVEPPQYLELETGIFKHTGPGYRTQDSKNYRAGSCYRIYRIYPVLDFPVIFSIGSCIGYRIFQKTRKISKISKMMFFRKFFFNNNNKSKLVK